MLVAHLRGDSMPLWKRRARTSASTVSAPPSGLSPRFCFVLSLIYFMIVVIAALLYAADLLGMDEIDDSRRMIPIAWAGSLGAVMANFTEIRQNSARWNPHLATWYVARPLVGAVFGAIGYLIYIAIVQASIITTSSGEVQASPTVLGYVVAFTLGYREETFRDLLQRVTDLLVSAGGGDVEPPSPPAQLGVAVSAKSNGDIELQWRPSTDNVGVTGYNVYRDYWFLALVRIESGHDHNKPTVRRNSVRPRGEAHGDADWESPEWVTFVDRSVDESTTFLYSVTAIDAAGNESKPAGPVRIGPLRRSQHFSSGEGAVAKEL